MLRSIFMLSAFALAATSGAALAQQGAQPQARAPQMELALEAAQAALAACAKDGVKGAASVVDSAGALRLLLPPTAPAAIRPRSAARRPPRRSPSRRSPPRSPTRWRR